MVQLFLHGTINNTSLFSDGIWIVKKATVNEGKHRNLFLSSKAVKPLAFAMGI